MATLFTWAQLKTKVQRDLDLQDELFITPDELLGYANEAIDEAEQEVLTIYEDYFLSNELLPLVADQDEYDLPTNVYAHKIRAILYNTPNKKYAIRRIKQLPRVNDVNSSETFFRYLIVNSLASGPKIKLYPASNETSAANVTIWFLRSARIITADTDVIDIPEAHKFIMQHIKLRCYEKEGSPNQNKAQQDLERERKLLVDTLAAMVPDEDNHIEPDMSFYDEFDASFYGYPFHYYY